MIKLIACDLDGTLLAKKSILTPATIETIQALKEKQIRFVIVTGRSYTSVTDLIKTYSDIWDFPMILNSGAEFRDKDEHIVHPIPKKTILDIVSLGQIHELPMTLHSVSNKYVIGDLQEHIDRSMVRLSKLHAEISMTELTERYHKYTISIEIEDLKNIDILKIDTHSPDYESFIRANEDLAKFETIDINSSRDQLIEITSSLHSKATMLNTVIEKYGIKPEEILVFGDSSNDRSMIKAFPNSYAMANGTDELKALAKHIAPDHNEDGVAKVIQKLIFNKEL